MFYIWLDFVDKEYNEPWFMLTEKDSIDDSFLFSRGAMLFAEFRASDFVNAMQKFQEIVSYELGYAGVAERQTPGT